MDIYTYLKKDHRKVTDLFEKLIHESKKPLKHDYFEQITNQLLIHAHAERITFYKALLKYSKSKVKVLHSAKTHKEIEQALNIINKLKFDSSEWLIQLGVLKSKVEYHVNQEEKEMFPIAKKVLSKSQAKALALEMDGAKQEIMAIF